MRIVLVRHGESQGNVDPTIHRTVADHVIPLSTRGIEQAREAGRQLDAFYSKLYGTWSKRPPIRLWTSPYLRTRQTADELVDHAGGWITDRFEHILLCEQQFGLFDGVPDEELPVLFPQEHAYYEKTSRFHGKFWARMPLGESRFDVAVRVHQCFGTFKRDVVDGVRDIVVICHGVTLRAFVMMWCHLSPEWFDSEPNPNNCAIRLLEDGVDLGYLFDGFPRLSPDER